MTAYLNQLIDMVGAHADLAYLTVFLSALLEALPVAGAVVPGSTIIVALGALIPGGDLKLVPMLTTAVAGALIGDGAGFWVGHVRQREILGVWPLSRYPQALTQSEAFFERYGALAVFFARFVPPFRAFVPMIAGALGVLPARFHAIDVVAAAVWAPMHILPGMLTVTVLHDFGGMHHHVAKRYWVPLVIAGGVVVLLAKWWWHRRRNTRQI